MTHTQTVLQALSLLPGATFSAIAEATGQKPKAVCRALELLKTSGRVVYAKLGRNNFYFADQAAHDAMIGELRSRYDRAQAEAKRITKGKDKARQLARYHDTKTLTGKPRGPKPITLIQPKPMNKEKAARLKFSAQVANIPAGIKVQKCPGFTGKHRYEADPNCYGAGFQAEWKQLRSAA